MPTTECPACSSAAVDAPVITSEMMFGLDSRFTYVVCGDCGTLRLDDVPADLAPYYPTDYYSVDIDPEKALGSPGVRQFATLTGRSVVLGRSRVAGLARRVVTRRQFHSYLRSLESVALAGLTRGKQSRVLDVGCGSGVLVYALGLMGLPEPLGVDPFASGDRTFDNGARILRRNLEEVDGEFDLIMLHHSFEHVPDPYETLRQVRERLARGGRILIRMPTPSSDAYEKYGREWVQMDAPRHLVLFTRQGMQALADRTGLVVRDVVDDSSSFQFWGSEQVRAHVPLMAPTSHMLDPKASAFSAAQVDRWEAEAERLNASSRGDQAAWVLVEP